MHQCYASLLTCPVRKKRPTNDITGRIDPGITRSQAAVHFDEPGLRVDTDDVQIEILDVRATAGRDGASVPPGRSSSVSYGC